MVWIFKLADNKFKITMANVLKDSAKKWAIYMFQMVILEKRYNLQAEGSGDGGWASRKTRNGKPREWHQKSDPQT